MPRFDKLEFDSPGEDFGDEDHDSSSGGSNAERRTWTQRANDERRQGHHENALRMYSRALEEDRTLVECWTGQIQMLILLGEYTEAEVWARKALELFPNQGELMAARAQALCRLGRLPEATASIDGALAQSGQSGYRWVVRGEVLLEGRQAANRHCFEKALQIDSDWLVAVETSLLLLERRQPSRASTFAKAATERAPDAPFAWLTLGACQSELGMAGPAAQSYARVLELSPGHRDAEIGLQSVRDSPSLWKRIRRLWSR